MKFDDLRANDEFYYYTIERADSEWRKSRLVKSEYIDGYDDLRIPANIAGSASNPDEGGRPVEEEE